ncbi:MAG: hypothetical protein WAV05_03375 [Anaerolineales bacterium]
MQTEIIQGIQLIFDPSEADIAGVISDASTKTLHIIHELTHACAAHLRLPAWLNEGLASGVGIIV